MNPEILAYKGQLSTARARRLHLDAEATGVMTQLRMLLRVGQEPSAVHIDQVQAMTARLVTLHAELQKLDKEIGELEAALG